MILKKDELNKLTQNKSLRKPSLNIKKSNKE